MFNFKMLTKLKPLGFLILTLLMTLILFFLYQQHGKEEYQSGVDDAVAVYEKQQSVFLNKAGTRALEAGFAANKFESQIDQTLKEALDHEKEIPVNHDCIDDQWLQQYNEIVGERGAAGRDDSG